MSQDIWTTINPTVTSGTTLSTTLNAFKNAIMSGFSGTTRPANLQAGGFWIDTSNATSNSYYSFKVWTGAVDIEVFRINVVSNFAGIPSVSSDFSITQISADTAAAIFGLLKQRIVSNGQVSNGDTIGEIQIVGRTNSSTDPIVGNIKWTSSDDETSSVFGGFLSFYSTSDATNTLTEHLRLISGFVETVVPQKINSLRLVGQNVATSATISQLSATKVLVEFTGSTATNLQGINSGQATQEIVLHNRSSVNVTLKHQDSGATAADRLKLPSSIDLLLRADSSVTLFYDITDSRWKLKSTHRFNTITKTFKTFKNLINDWVCPAGVTSVVLTPYSRRQIMSTGHKTMIDAFGNLYAWGLNNQGGCGDGTIIHKSSPTAVLGSGRIYTRLIEGNCASSFEDTDNNPMAAIDNKGLLYSWGWNANGQLGDGTVVSKSSPIAVLGGFKWNYIFSGDRTFMAGITTNGLSYAWGKPPVGSISGTPQTAASSPVAFLGGFSFDSFVYTGQPGTSAMAGLDINGNAYVWGGGNAIVNFFIKGGGGNGTPTANISSPIAVIGGLTFKKIQIGASGGQSGFCVGLTKDGLAYAWGDNANGQLGDGTVVSKSSPVAVLGGLTFTDIFVPQSIQSTGARNAASCFGMTEDGTLYAWGIDLRGELGVGGAPTGANGNSYSSPIAVLGGLKFRDFTGGWKISAGITFDGVMYTWGDNGAFGLGNGDQVARSSPVAVVGSIKWSQFCHQSIPGATDEAPCITAVAEDGTMYSWGFQVGGELGDGTAQTLRSTPVAVVGGFAFDNRYIGSPISIPVTPGNTYRVYIPSGVREARFGNVAIGSALEKVSIEYDTI